MNQSTIATNLLMLFASGGTFERTVADLPLFKAQIESTLGWMKTAGQCSATEITKRATHLGGLIRRKDEAIQRRDFDLAATIRAEECKIFESFGLKTPTGDAWHTILYVGVDEQMRHLSALLSEVNMA